jgi:hypothetical protein
MMKTKNHLLLIVALLSVLTSAACRRDNPIPDPGYRITSYFQIIDSWGFAIVTRKDPDKLFDAELVASQPGAPGSVGFWTRRTNALAELDILDGIAPGDWFIASLDGVCQGTGFQTFIQRGQNKNISCRVPEHPFFFFASPDYIDVDSPPSSVTISGSGIDTSSGMPTVEYWDQNGYLVAQQQASQVAADGTWLSGPTPDLSQVYSGNYLLRIRSATGEVIGDAAVQVFRFEPPPPPPDEDPCSLNQSPNNNQMEQQPCYQY